MSRTHMSNDRRSSLHVHQRGRRAQRELEAHINDMMRIDHQPRPLLGNEALRFHPHAIRIHRQIRHGVDAIRTCFRAVSHAGGLIDYGDLSCGHNGGAGISYSAGDGTESRLTSSRKRKAPNQQKDRNEVERYAASYEPRCIKIFRPCRDPQTFPQGPYELALAAAVFSPLLRPGCYFDVSSVYNGCSCHIAFRWSSTATTFASGRPKTKDLRPVLS